MASPQDSYTMTISPPLPIYTPSQLNSYLASISFPSHLYPTSPTTPPRDLTYLSTLFLHHIGRFPYDNLSLHYSRTHTISLDPQTIFAKAVTADRGRGGYCMEMAILFTHVLTALGFDAYLVGARNRPRLNGLAQGDWRGWVHSVNIVTLEGRKWMCDVCFGGDGPTAPLPMDAGPEPPVHTNLGTQECRLLRAHLPGQRDAGSWHWIYQVRNNATLEWSSYHGFQDAEWLEPDFEGVNFYVSNATYQATSVILARYVREEGRIVGKRMLVDGVFKENMGGRTRTVKVCESEHERVRYLEEFLGIGLTEEERVGIRGRVSELKGAVDGDGGKRDEEARPVADGKRDELEVRPTIDGIKNGT